MTRPAWIEAVPTHVLEMLVACWDEGFVVVGHDGIGHPFPCDGSAHDRDWTGAVGAELVRRLGAVAL